MLQNRLKVSMKGSICEKIRSSRRKRNATLKSPPIMTTAHLTVYNTVKTTNYPSCCLLLQAAAPPEGPNNSLLCRFAVIKPGCPSADVEARGCEALGSCRCKSSTRACIYRVSLQEDSASTKVSRRLPQFFIACISASDTELAFQ